MRRSSVAAVAIALSLAGCPLPQPLPNYPAGTVTPPRILAATTTSGVNALLPVPAGCAIPPAYALDARLFYQESVTVEARWFVDYRADLASRSMYADRAEVPPDPNALVLERQVPAYTFRPYEFPPATELGTSVPGPPWSAPGVVHVVELVVSNGFAVPPDDAQQPNRTPATTADGTSQFEIQTYRWVFVTVPASAPGSCNAGDPGCALCP